MDEVSAMTLLDRLGCRRIRVVGYEVMSSCPYPENHSHGDRRPSFSAAINDGDASPYWCFACHISGTLEGLAYQTDNKDLISEQRLKQVKSNTWLRVPSTNAGKFQHLYKKNRKPVLFKDDYLKPFVGVLSGYVSKRGITLDTARAWELGLDKRNRRAIFPVRDYLGRLGGIVGRDITGKGWVKYSNYVLDRRNKRMVPFIDHDREEDFISPTKSCYLYGEYKAWNVSKGVEERTQDGLIVVEGAMDALRLWQAGWNVVAILGSYASDAQVEKIITVAPRKGRLIVMADGDDAGRRMTVALGDKIGNRIPIFDAVLEDGLDPGDATDEQIECAIKDARTIGLTNSK